MITLLLATLCLALAYVLMIWLLSLLIGRVSIIDAFWGPGFVLLAMLCYVMTSDAGWGRAETVLVGMVTVWGTRLGVHLAIRVLNDPHEDRRYAAMKANHQSHWWLKSLGIVFLLQGLIMWFVALPITASFAFETRPSIDWLAPLGLVCWAIGVFFEAVGDWQLVRFRADPANQGRVLDAGLWRLTRHPNYFGDFAVWWGLWLFCLGCGAPFWTVASPLVMSVFLMKVSGVVLLEKDIAGRRPEYVDYIRLTNSFFPGPKKALR